MSSSSNVIMCMAVASMVPPILQAYLRCAGSIGFSTVKELMDMQTAAIPAHLEVVAISQRNDKEQQHSSSSSAQFQHVSSNQFITDDGSEVQGVPVLLHSKCSFLDGQSQYQPPPAFSGDVSCVVYSHAAIMKCGLDPYNIEILHHSLRYEWDRNLTCIPTKFLNLYAPKLWKMKGFVHIVGLEDVTEIESHFLDMFGHASSLQLDSLDNLTKIGNNFAFGCGATSIDIGGKNMGRKLVHIGSLFLHGCSQLERIRLSPSPVGNVMSYITHIGPSFMSGCSSLTSFEMSDLVNLEKIEYYFLSSCSSLKTVVLLDMNKVSEIDDGCMQCCSHLDSVTMTGLGYLTTIKNKFLADCGQLKTTNISKLSNVAHIGKKFMSNCQEIRCCSGEEGEKEGRIVGVGGLISQLVAVETIGRGFMRGCDNFDRRLVDRKGMPAILQDCLDGNKNSHE